MGWLAVTRGVRKSKGDTNENSDVAGFDDAVELDDLLSGGESWSKDINYGLS